MHECGTKVQRCIGSQRDPQHHEESKLGKNGKWPGTRYLCSWKPIPTYNSVGFLFSLGGFIYSRKFFFSIFTFSNVIKVLNNGNCL